MKFDASEYVRIDLMTIVNISQGITTAYWETTNWFQTQPDSEWRDDHQCFFVVKGSPTHTLAALKYGDVFG
jgi:hypothetical protein